MKKLLRKLDNGKLRQIPINKKSKDLMKDG